MSRMKLHQIQAREFLPVREDQQRVSVCGCLLNTSRIAHLAGARYLRFSPRHRRWIVRHNRTTLGQQHLYKVDRGRFANVIRVALEGQPEHGEPLAAQRPQRRANFAQEPLLLIDC